MVEGTSWIGSEEEVVGSMAELFPKVKSSRDFQKGYCCNEFSNVLKYS